MSRIVHIRHERIAVACAHPEGCEAEAAHAPYPRPQQSAEIILFPMIHRGSRPRKRLTRRFQRVD